MKARRSELAARADLFLSADYVYCEGLSRILAGSEVPWSKGIGSAGG